MGRTSAILNPTSAIPPFVLFPPPSTIVLRTMVSIQLFQPGKYNVQMQFPSSWNELLLQELHAVAKVLLTTEVIPERAMLLDTFFKIRSKEQKVKLPPKLMGRLSDEDAVINGYPLFNFIFDQNDLTEQPYNRIKLPGFMPCTVYGPQSAFDDITCGEYEDAHIFYLQFKTEPLPEHLARMMAILWRPKHSPFTTHHSRKPYLTVNHNTNTFTAYNPEQLFTRFLKLPLWVLFTAFTWYDGCQNELQKIFHEVYTINKTNQQPETSDQEPDLLAFTRCIHAGAGPKNGTRDQIRNIKLKEFLFDVQEEIIKSNELTDAK